MEAEEYFSPPTVQSVSEAAPVELLTQVIQTQDKIQQTLLQAVEAQTHMQMATSDSRICFRCGKPGISRCSAFRRRMNQMLCLKC